MCMTPSHCNKDKGEKRVSFNLEKKLGRGIRTLLSPGIPRMLTISLHPPGKRLEESSLEKRSPDSGRHWQLLPLKIAFLTVRLIYQKGGHTEHTLFLVPGSLTLADSPGPPGN